MAKHKGVYGKDWWNCNYCKLCHSIMYSGKARPPLPCATCDKRDLVGAEPELLTSGEVQDEKA